MAEAEHCGRCESVTTEEPAEDISIRGDERALKQVMLNVLSNAIKFSHEGGRVIVRTTAPDPETLVVEIEDFGIGMDEHIIRNYFSMAGISYYRSSEFERQHLG